MNEKIMPHNLDAEKSVLGSMFLSKYAQQKALESLSKDLFYSDANAKIFEAINKIIFHIHKICFKRNINIINKIFFINFFN